MISTFLGQLISELITILFLGLAYFGRVKYYWQEGCPVSLSLTIFFKEMHSVLLHSIIIETRLYVLFL